MGYEALIGWWDKETADKARSILRAILETDECGQGVRYAEAMDAAKEFLKKHPENR